MGLLACFRGFHVKRKMLVLSSVRIHILGFHVKHLKLTRVGASP